MKIVEITQEQFDNNDYPLCRRCQLYQNMRSSVFGDAWGCAKEHSSVEVDDNDFDMETNKNLLIHDCGD